MKALLAGAGGGLAATITSRFVEGFLMEAVVGIVAGLLVGALVMYLMRTRTLQETDL